MSRRWKSIARVAVRKLVQIDSVTSLEELNVAPRNRLEALKGDRAGLHGIRINDRWRICFRWGTDGVYDVEIVDYYLPLRVASSRAFSTSGLGNRNAI